LRDKIKKNEIGGACGTYGEEAHAGFWWAVLKEEDHLEDPGIDGRIILNWMLREMGQGHGLN
jgi:hypothetical protein